MATKKGVPNSQATQFKSGADAVEKGRKGGIASGKSKRKKKTMLETLQNMIDEVADIKDNDKKLTYRELATLGLIKGSIYGNVANYKAIMEILGELKENNSISTPSLKIEVIDNSKLEKVLYDEDEKN